MREHLSSPRFNGSAPVAAQGDEVREALGWLAGQPQLELHHYSPVYCDDDDQDTEWRVTKVSGPINDREWDIVGRGETPIAALIDARAALATLGAPHEG